MTSNARRKELRRRMYAGKAPLDQAEIDRTFGKQIAAILVALGLIVGAAAMLLFPRIVKGSELTFTLTAPTKDDEAVCGGLPWYVPGTDSIWLVAIVPQFGYRDSVKAARGEKRRFSWPAYSGVFPVTVYARKTGWNQPKGCERVFNVPVLAPPARVSMP